MPNINTCRMWKLRILIYKSKQNFRCDYFSFCIYKWMSYYYNKYFITWNIIWTWQGGCVLFLLSARGIPSPLTLCVPRRFGSSPPVLLLFLVFLGFLSVTWSKQIDGHIKIFYLRIFLLVVWFKTLENSVE